MFVCWCASYFDSPSQSAMLFTGLVNLLALRSIGLKSTVAADSYCTILKINLADGPKSIGQLQGSKSAVILNCSHHQGVKPKTRPPKTRPMTFGLPKIRNAFFPGAKEIAHPVRVLTRRSRAYFPAPIQNPKATARYRIREGRFLQRCNRGLKLFESQRRMQRK